MAAASTRFLYTVPPANVDLGLGSDQVSEGEPRTGWGECQGRIGRRPQRRHTTIRSDASSRRILMVPQATLLAIGLSRFRFPGGEVPQLVGVASPDQRAPRRLSREIGLDR